jgi:outer membrane protein TolC
LDTPRRLAGVLTPLDLPELSLEALEKQASGERPEVRGSRLAEDLARTQSQAARSSLWPVVGVKAGVEADRQRFVDRGGVNWMASVGLRWNLFNGNADKARMEESAHLLERANAEQKQVDSAVRLEVRRAWSGLRSAQQRIEVARAAVAEAEESLRITQNRYAAGMSNVTDLLRTETAVLESRTRYLAAVHDQRVAATMLELAAGRLNADSEVLN